MFIYIISKKTDDGYHIVLASTNKKEIENYISENQLPNQLIINKIKFVNFYKQITNDNSNNKENLIFKSEKIHEGNSINSETIDYFNRKIIIHNGTIEETQNYPNEYETLEDLIKTTVVQANFLNCSKRQVLQMIKDAMKGRD